MTMASSPTLMWWKLTLISLTTAAAAREGSVGSRAAREVFSWIADDPGGSIRSTGALRNIDVVGAGGIGDSDANRVRNNDEVVVVESGGGGRRGGKRTESGGGGGILNDDSALLEDPLITELLVLEWEEKEDELYSEEGKEQLSWNQSPSSFSSSSSSSSTSMDVGGENEGMTTTTTKAKMFRGGQYDDIYDNHYHYDYDYDYYDDDQSSLSASSYASTRSLSSSMSMFQPLSCNVNIDSVDCSPSSSTSHSLISLINSAAATSAEVIVPCGECAYWDLPASITTEVPGGLNVLGKLLIPETSGGVLRTTNIYIQGVLQIDPLLVPNTVKFLLYGTTPKSFFPYDVNGSLCDATTGCDVGKKPIVVAGGKLDVRGIVEDSCPSWVKLHHVYPDSNGAINKIDVGPDAASCWLPNDKILLTSPDMHYTYRETATIQAIADGTSFLLTNSISDVFAEATEVANPNHQYFAIEVARLTRPVIFEAEHDDSTNGGFVGGHLIIYHTEGVAQKLHGVMIDNFGQQGFLGRYPIHFHMCDDVTGSVVSKNVIMNSNQRGIVIHGTHNVDIQDNIAFGVYGHCFFTEDGIETGNIFSGNLGADIKVPTHLITGENDNQPSVFWITNPDNTWIGNVAAGGESNGFWFDTRDQVRGPSLTVNTTDINPRSTNIGLFTANVVHSMNQRGIQLYSPGWQPTVENVLSNNIVFRIRMEGYFLHGNQNIKITGGVVSDCGKVGIFNFRASNIVLDDIELIGYSEEYDRVRTITQSWWFCQDAASSLVHSMIGMTIHPWRNLPTTTSWGTKASNLTFRRFGSEETGCTSTNQAAIVMSTLQIVDFYDTPNTFESLTFDGTMKRLEVCDAHAEDINNINIEDVDGSIMGTGNGGFFVSNETYMTAFATPSNNVCTPVSDTCDLAYCEGSCLRQITFRTNNAYSTRHIDIVISSYNHGNTTIMDEWHQFAYLGSTHHSTYSENNGKYSATLPYFDGTFDISFIDSNTGEEAWPDYVEIEYEEAPTCASAVVNAGRQQSIYQVNQPSRTISRCSTNLVKNGDFENGTFDGWQQSSSGTVLSLSSTGYDGSTHSLHVDRTTGYVSQWLDISCIGENTMYKFSAMIQLISRVDGSVLTTCEPETNEADCPTAELHFYTWYVDTKERTLLSSSTLGTVTTASSGDGWYKMEGTTGIITAEEAASSRAQILIQNPSNVNYNLDLVNLVIIDVIIMGTSTPPIDIHGRSDIVENLPASYVSASSSYNFNYRPIHAVDGKVHTQWATKGQGTNSWIKLIFENNVMHKATYIGYKSRKQGDFVSEFQLSFSDGSTQNCQMTTDGSANEYQYFDIIDVETTFVKLQVVSTSGANPGAHQISVYGELSPDYVPIPIITGDPSIQRSILGLDMALQSMGSSVDASSYYQNNADYDPSHAVDASSTSQWASNGDGTATWMKINFFHNTEQNITHFAYKSRGSDHVTEFTLTFSDGSKQIGQMDSSAQNSVQYFDIDDVTTSFVKFEVNHGDINAGACQISAYIALSSSPVLQGTATVPSNLGPDVALFALGTAVSASSYYNNNVNLAPEHAVESQGNKQWSSWREGTNTWMELNFGHDYELTGIGYQSRNEPDYVSKFALVFGDGSSVICDMDTSVNDGVMQYFDMAGIIPGVGKTDKIRFKVEAGGVNAGARQISAFTIPSPVIVGSTVQPSNLGIDLALNQNVIASSHFHNSNNLRPQHVVDNNPSSQWASWSDGKDSWIQIDLGGSYQNIATFGYRSRGAPQDYVKKFVLKMSDGSLQFCDMPLGANSNLQYFTLHQPVNTTFVRFKVVEGAINSGGYQMSVYAAPP